MKVTGVTEDSLALDWDEPKDDGGSEIIQYVVEKREASKRTWQEALKTEDLDTTISDLVEGQTYMFRVAAENEVGVGEFAELSQAVAPKSQHGKLCKT